MKTIVKKPEVLKSLISVAKKRAQEKESVDKLAQTLPPKRKGGCSCRG
jgi:hypothetical protein